MDFDRFAGNYTDLVDGSTSISGESSEYFVQYKAKYLMRFLGPGPWKVLDFGCGVGTLSSALASVSAESILHGFDVSPVSIEQVEPKLKLSGHFTTDWDSLDTDYNLVVVSNVLHHIEPPDRETIFRDLSARIAPGGHIVVFEHNPLNPLTRWVVAHCPFDEGVHLLHPSEAARYFALSGVAKLRKDYIVFFPNALAFLRPAEPFLGWCPGGAQFAMVGRKDVRSR